MKLESISSNSAVKWLIWNDIFGEEAKTWCCFFLQIKLIWRHGEVGICNHVCHLYQFIIYIILRFNMKPSMKFVFEIIKLPFISMYLYHLEIWSDMKPPWKGQGLAHGSHYFQGVPSIGLDMVTNDGPRYVMNTHCHYDHMSITGVACCWRCRFQGCFQGWKKEARCLEFGSPGRCWISLLCTANGLKINEFSLPSIVDTVYVLFFWVFIAI